MRTAYIDMDGVCCNFMAEAIRLQGQDPDKVIGSWPKGLWEPCDLLRITQKEFWKAINDKGAEFWAGLSAYPWFNEMYGLLGHEMDVCFLTSPGLDASAGAGKITWLQRRFGRQFRSYIITYDKYRLARPDAVLIDDHPIQCQRFANAGGKSILFPQPWNIAPPIEAGRVGTEIPRLAAETLSR